MEYLLFIFACIAYYLPFVLMCNYGQMKWSSFVLLLLTFTQPLTISFILLFAIQAQDGLRIEGPISSVISMVISASILLVALLVLIYSNKGIIKNSSIGLGWILFGLAIFAQIFGLFGSLSALYLPSIFGSEAPLPKVCVSVYLTGTTISAVLLALQANINGHTKVNLFRWLAFFTVLICINQTTIIAFLLLYGFQGSAQIIYANSASIVTVGFFPYSLTLLYISNRYVKNNS